MRMPTRRLIFLPILAVALVCGIALSGGHAEAVTLYPISSAVTGYCIQEDGTTSAVYTSGCNLSNHSDLWALEDDEIINDHSGLCLTVDGTNPGVYAAECTGNHAQLWDLVNAQYPCGSACYSFLNGHTGYALFGGTYGGGLDQEAADGAYMDWNI
jgi:hypothetical protein